MRQGIGGGFEHFASAARVHVDHPHAHIGGNADRSSDGVWDVVEFKIKKNVVPLLVQGFQQCSPFAGIEFFAYFEAALPGSQLCGKTQGIVTVIDVKGNKNRSAAHRFSTLSSSNGRKLLQAKQAGQCQIRFCWRKPHSLHWYTVRGRTNLPALCASGA